MNLILCHSEDSIFVILNLFQNTTINKSPRPLWERSTTQPPRPLWERACPVLDTGVRVRGYLPATGRQPAAKDIE